MLLFGLPFLHKISKVSYCHLILFSCNYLISFLSAVHSNLSLSISILPFDAFPFYLPTKPCAMARFKLFLRFLYIFNDISSIPLIVSPISLSLTEPTSGLPHSIPSTSPNTTCSLSSCLSSRPNYNWERSYIYHATVINLKTYHQSLVYIHYCCLAFTIDLIY